METAHDYDTSLTTSRRLLDDAKTSTEPAFEATQNTGYFLTLLDMAIREAHALRKETSFHVLYYGQKTRVVIGGES